MMQACRLFMLRLAAPPEWACSSFLVVPLPTSPMAVRDRTGLIHARRRLRPPAPSRGSCLPCHCPMNPWIVRYTLRRRPIVNSSPASCNVTHEPPTALERGRVTPGPPLPWPVSRLCRADVLAAPSIPARIRHPRLPRRTRCTWSPKRERAVESGFAPCLSHDLPPPCPVAAALKSVRPRPTGCPTRRRRPPRSHTGGRGGLVDCPH